MDQPLRVAVVTGASRGIGRDIAGRLAEEGFAVCVNHLKDTERADQVASAIRLAGGLACVAEADVSDLHQVEAMVGYCVDTLGPPTVLINNAAIFPWTPWQSIECSEWDRVFAVNVRGCWLMAKAVFPYMEAANWGRIVSMASATYLTGSAELMHYSASKGAVVGLTRSLALAGGPHGITANAVSTGKVITEGFEQYFAEGVLDIDAVASSRNHQPIARLGQGRDCAAAIAYLTSNDASYVTGQLVNVDGGRHMY